MKTSKKDNHNDTFTYQKKNKKRESLIIYYVFEWKYINYWPLSLQQLYPGNVYNNNLVKVR